MISRHRFTIRNLNESISNLRSKYVTNGSISEDTFNTLINLDPTYNGSDREGDYTKWILSKYVSGKLTRNDFGHAKDALTRFNDNKNNLMNKDISARKDIADIDRYLDDSGSYKMRSDRQALRQTQKSVRATDLGKDAEKIFSGDGWEIWVPHTYEASCKLGVGSSWCTASTANSYYFNHYNGEGDLKIFVPIGHALDPKADKYQLHVESRSFMDKTDSSQPFLKTLTTIGGQSLVDFLRDDILEFYGIEGHWANKDKNMFSIDVDAYDLAQAIYENCGGYNREFVSRDFILACFQGEEGIFDRIVDWYMDYTADDNILDNISEENYLKIKNEFGMSREDLQEIFNDGTNSIYNNSVTVAIDRAYESTFVNCTADRIQLDFNRAMDKAVPKGFDWSCDTSGRSKDDAKVTLTGPLEALYSYIIQADGFEDLFSEIGYQFGEEYSYPYYGYEEWDEEVFNQLLADELGSI